MAHTSALARRTAVGCLSWFLISFPSAHLREIYVWHHYTKGAVGLHPSLVDAYIRKSCWLTAVLALCAPIVILTIGKLIFRRANSASGCLWAGPIIGLIAAVTMYSQLKADFLAITNVELDESGYLYSGLLSGVIVGELYRRYYLSAAGVRATDEGLRRQFLLSTLMTWAVLLKILESLYLSSLPPGRDPFGIHAFMFLSVLLWTPLVCIALWRFRPYTFLPTAGFMVAVGIVLPYLVGWLLTFPVVISLYAGVTPSIYGMLWGRLLLNVSDPPSTVATAFIAPGLVWGAIVAFLWLGVRAAERAGNPGTNEEIPRPASHA